MKPCFVEVEAADEAMTIQDYDNNKLVDSGRLFFLPRGGSCGVLSFVRDASSGSSIHSIVALCDCEIYSTSFKALLWRF